MNLVDNGLCERVRLLNINSVDTSGYNIDTYDLVDRV